ncbi:MAG: alpha/beta fold hydrolase [Bacteroidales bacterium]|nr:alpha/beta fold hydrolase [Bacteroidales bacterium]
MTIVSSFDGLQLQARLIAPEKPKAVVVLVHGMAEHKERYYPFMTWLSEMGYACLITDLRGHGATVTTPDDLGHFGKNALQALVEDTCSVLRYAHQLYPGLKVFLFGHSMGSMVVRATLKRQPELLDGLIVCGSPSKNPAAGLGIFLTQLIRIFRGDRHRSMTIAVMMFGTYEMKFSKADGIHNAWLSTNRANVQAYNNDPLCGYKFTLNGYRTVLQLMQDIYNPKGWSPAREELPVHFIAGADDPCITSLKDFSKAVSFVRQMGYRTVTSKVYPGLRHEILNEIGKEDVWRDVEAVLNSWL